VKIPSRLLQKLIGLLALLLFGGCASDNSRMKSDWERAHEGQLIREEASQDVALPAYPQAGALLPFTVSGSSDFRYFVDPASLVVARDGVVRYTVVARSGSGADNVSYEGLNCKASEYALYAVGQADRSWRRSFGVWKPIERPRWQKTLAEQYFCPNGVPIASAAEGIDALRRGGHPWAHAQDAPVSGSR
jgi:CNP1-like family protein